MTGPTPVRPRPVPVPEPAPTAAVGPSLAGHVTRFAEIVATTAFSRRDGAPVDTDAAVTELAHRLMATRNGNSVYVIGNGGSAAVAAHLVNDFVNMGRLRALTLHDAALMTCMANDYGYENAYARMVSTMARAGDVLVAISSSGRSPNMLKATAAATELGATVVTLSGFAPDTPLRSAGDLNAWVDSSDYGLVETAHQFILHTVADHIRLATPRQD